MGSSGESRGNPARVIAIVRIGGASRGRTCVLEVEIVLMLDTQEMKLKSGEIEVQRGTNHAFSNQQPLGQAPAVAMASHEGKY